MLDGTINLNAETYSKLLPLERMLLAIRTYYDNGIKVLISTEIAETTTTKAAMVVG